ncbi:DUF2066 domain-containing protein [Chromatiaceae bacterium AAb-1]|nr:DUF2066 domain-containing protein [Chromatiaceae bacterium AAb-1]
MRWGKQLGALCLLLSSQLLAAAEITDLYVADVAANQSTQQWQQQALLQVLVRVSGQADAGDIPAVREELRRAAAYIKQFEAVRQQQENRIKVLLDATRINALLQQQQLPVWGAQRPELLVWLVEQTPAERRFVRSADNPMLSALNRSFKEKALPLMLPLYDIEDLQHVSETDIWAGFWQQINQASGRYNADIIIVAMIEHLDSGYRLNWQRQLNGRTLRHDVTAENEHALMEQFSAQLAATLAQQFAVMFSAETASGKALLDVEGIADLTDLVSVQQALQQVSGVNNVTITAFSGKSTRFMLDISMADAELLKALQFERRLRQQDNPISLLPSVDSEAVSEPALAVYRYIRP